MAVTPGAIFAVLINDVSCDQVTGDWRVSVVLECDQIIKADMRHGTVAAGQRMEQWVTMCGHQQTSPNGNF